MGYDLEMEDDYRLTDTDKLTEHGDDVLDVTLTATTRGIRDHIVHPSMT